MSEKIDRTSRESESIENLEQAKKLGLHHPVWMLRKHQRDMHIDG